jgi:hypothetical protein
LGQKKKWYFKTGDLLKEFHFIWKFLTEQEKGDLLIQVTAWTGLAVFSFIEVTSLGHLQCILLKYIHESCFSPGGEVVGQIMVTYLYG